MNKEKIKTNRGIVLLLLYISLTYTVQAMEFASVTEDQTTLVAMFGFATLGILSMAFYSFRFKRAALKNQEMLQLKEEIAVKHHAILESMTHNIEVAAKGIRNYKEVLKRHDLKTIRSDIFHEEMDRFVENETLLLDTTNELLDFLQIKSGNLKILEDPYNLNSMLNETYESITNEIIKNKSELLYDIDPNIATELEGDIKRIKHVLRTFLLDILTEKSHNAVTIKLSLPSNNSNIIRFALHNRDKKILNEKIDDLFSNSADSIEKLDLYIASELIKLMNGKLDIQSSEANGTTYAIELAYKPLGMSFIKSHSSLDKRLLILEDDEERSSLVSGLFEQHNLHIDKADSQSLVSHIPDFGSYDMIIVNTKLLFLTIVEKLEKAKKENSLIIVETYNRFESRYTDKSNGLVDEFLQKPLQNEQIYHLLEKVFGTNTAEKTPKTLSDQFAPLKKVDRITTESFKRFSDTQVLIVEDNQMNQKILRSILRSSGMSITMLNNGQEAVKEIEQNKNYDMILMDINMPVMDGVDATKIIRKQYDKEQLPIIAISAVGFEDDILKMQNVGANGYLHKPFQLGELYSAFLMFGINSKDKINTETLQIPNHTIDSNILNINTGVEQLNSEEKYKEFLQEVLLNLKEIEVSVEKWITKRKYKKTKEFILYALKLAEAIGASSFKKILKEMEQLFIDQEEGRITEYVSLYNKEWQRLRQEIERYLKISS